MLEQIIYLNTSKKYHETKIKYFNIKKCLDISIKKCLVDGRDPTRRAEKVDAGYDFRTLVCF